MTLVVRAALCRASFLFILFPFSVAELSAEPVQAALIDSGETVELCVVSPQESLDSASAGENPGGARCHPGPTPTPSPTPSACPDCPPVLVITLNGVNADHDSPFHNLEDWLDVPLWPGQQILVDPFHGIFQACGAHPLKPSMLDAIRDSINEWKEANPCGKVLIIGHSMGGVTAWGLRNDGDCVFALDPPLNSCNGCSSFWCQSMKDTCHAIQQGIEDWPGYVNWEDEGLPHTPFGNPNDNCDQLKDAENRIRQCLSDVAPDCDQWRQEGYSCGTIITERNNSLKEDSREEFYNELHSTVSHLEMESLKQLGIRAEVYPSSCAPSLSDKALK